MDCQAQSLVSSSFIHGRVDLGDRQERSVPISVASRCSKVRVQKLNLLDHVGGLNEEMRRHVKAECLGGLEIDDEVKLCWLLDWQITRLRALEDLVYICGGAPIHVRKVYYIGHQAAGFNVLSEGVAARQSMLEREVRDEL